VAYTFVGINEKIDFDLVKEQAISLKINPFMESVLGQVVSGEKSKGYKVFTQLKMAVL
jgi:hypothetical protein